MKVAVAGGGYGSKVALPVYSELEEFQPVAVWSRRPERARELAEQRDWSWGRRTSSSSCASPDSRRSTSRLPW